MPGFDLPWRANQSACPFMNQRGRGITRGRRGRGCLLRETVGARRTAVRRNLPTSTLLLRLDLVEFGKRSFKFGIEEPHRIKNFAEGCRCSCPVSLSKGEDAVVSQISHDPRLGDSIIDQVA